MLCSQCNNDAIDTGCAYCLKEKIQMITKECLEVKRENLKLIKEIDFLKNELELIHEQDKL